MMFDSRSLCNSAWKCPDCTDKVEGCQFQWTLDEDLTALLVLLLRSTHSSLYTGYPSANWFAPRKKYNFSCWVWIQVGLNIASTANGDLAVWLCGAAPTPAHGLTRASGTCFTRPPAQGEQNTEQTNVLGGNPINLGLPVVCALENLTEWCLQHLVQQSTVSHFCMTFVIPTFLSVHYLYADTVFLKIPA